MKTLATVIALMLFGAAASAQVTRGVISMTQVG